MQVNGLEIKADITIREEDGSVVKCDECKKMKPSYLVQHCRQIGDLNKSRNVCVNCLCGE